MQKNRIASNNGRIEQIVSTAHENYTEVVMILNQEQMRANECTSYNQSMD